MIKKGIIYETLGKVQDLQIVESSNPNDVRLSGVFGVCGVKNGNNRIYDRKNYGMMVEGLQKAIMNEGVVGELEHPNTMNINLANISHKIEAINLNEDGTVTGTIKLLDTPNGKIAKSLVEGGVTLYISSRGAGSVDESGNVTLTQLKTYDLVGTPGFSQAKLSLDKNQTFESLNESLENPCWMIVEGEEDDKKDDKKEEKKEEKVEEPKKDEKPAEDHKKEDPKKEDPKKDNDKEDNKSNDNIEGMQELKKSIDELTSKVEQLEAQLHIANECIKEQESLIESVKPNYAAIQEWIEVEYGTNLKEELGNKIQNWITEEYTPSNNADVKQEITQSVTESLAPVIQKWITEEYSPEIQKWITEEYSPEIQKWITEEYSPEIQNWITEEYSPVIQGWVTEEFAPEHAQQITESVNKNVSDYLESEKSDKHNHIDEMLESLSMLANKQNETVETPVVENKDKYAGNFVVESMPAQYKPIWAVLDESKKDEILAMSRAYDFTKKGVMESFWASQNLSMSMVTESAAPVQNEVSPLSGIASRMRSLMGR